MAEKERYTGFACGCCVDNQNDLKIVNCLDRLNEQDKRIKELEEDIKRISEINLYNKDLALTSLKDLI